MEHQGSYGCRGCSNGHNVLAVAGSGARRAGRPSAAQSAGAAEPAAAPHHVAKVVIANPVQVRLIAEARVKTDKIDAAILAQLYASGFLPQVWMPDDRTQALRRQVARRSQIVRHRTRLKNEIHSVLAAHLIPQCPAADLFGRKGRVWLSEQPLPMTELNDRSGAPPFDSASRPLPVAQASS